MPGDIVPQLNLNSTDQSNRTLENEVTPTLTLQGATFTTGGSSTGTETSNILIIGAVALAAILVLKEIK